MESKNIVADSPILNYQETKIDFKYDDIKDKVQV